MNGIDLARRRELGELIEDTWRLYTGNLSLFLPIAMIVVVPVELLVVGVGFGELWKSYDPNPNLGPSAVGTALRLLVVQPLVTAAHIAAVMALGQGERPSPWWSITRGLTRWAAVLGAVLLAGVAVLAGFVAFAIPGIYLLVVFYFGAQAVVAEDRGPVDALRRSKELVSGQFWRVFGIGIVFSVLIGVVAATVSLGAAAIADATGRELFVLLGSMLSDVFTIAFTALAGTLVFFDLRVRAEGVPPPPRWAPEGWEAPAPGPSQAGWATRPSPDPGLPS
jgi:hypothetical protein